MELINIKGIGEKTVKLLNNLNIYNTNDLVNYFPYDYTIIKPVEFTYENKEYVINAKIVSVPKVFFIKRNLNRLTFKVSVNNSIINVTIFNRAFLRPNLTLDKMITLIGKYDKLKNSFVASDIKTKEVLNMEIIPKYHLISGLKNSNVHDYIVKSIDSTNVNDDIPDYYINKYKLLDYKSALNYIHQPKNEMDIKKARNRIVYGELFDFTFKMNYLHNLRSSINNGIKRKPYDKELNDFIASIPFNLTKDQIEACNAIKSDMTSSKKMNRLLLGDVGSGKTIVAIYAIYLNYLNGYQSMLMAPTEILAYQNYLKVKEFLESFNVNVAFLSSSTSKKERTELLNNLKNNKIDVVVGTHSLLNEEIVLNNLGLVIADEQHRFGVKQRALLVKKGTNLDFLSASATPIPRTYALTLFGDMDTSLIKTKPSNRLDIITKLYKESDIKEVLKHILEEIKLNHQVYVVSPLILKNDELDLTDVMNLKEKFELAFNNLIPIGVLHGKLKNKEKDKVMDDFKKGITKILISTTVVEVGVDVPNATVMVIYNAYMFGLATLHQLRGRVGRGGIQSYCYLISNKESERLHIMEESNDGFFISKKDFELRGSGDLFGVEQSGDVNFKLASFKKDYNILLKAKEDSLEFLNSDLEGYQKYIDIIETLKEVD